MSKAKIVLLAVTIAGILSAVYASQQAPIPCVLYTPDANGVCNITWTGATLESGTQFVGNISVTDKRFFRCMKQDVWLCE